MPLSAGTIRRIVSASVYFVKRGISFVRRDQFGSEQSGKEARCPSPADDHAAMSLWTLPEHDSKPGRPKKNGEKSPIFNIAEFADLGIAGLTTRDTVRAYRQAWSWAIEHGHAKHVGPGETVELPRGVDFPPTTTTYTHPHRLDTEYEAAAASAGITKDAVRRVAANKAALTAAIKADPEVEQAAWEAIQEKQAGKAAERRKEYGVTCPPTPPTKENRDSLADNGFGDQMDAAIEETRRRDSILELLSLSQKVRDSVASIKAEHSHTRC